MHAQRSASRPGGWWTVWGAGLLAWGCARGAGTAREAEGAKPVDSGGADSGGQAEGSGDGGDTGAGGAGPVDADRDGAASDVDCDDTDPLSHPGATEVYNGVDDDCDGRADADGDYGALFVLAGTAEFEGVVEAWSIACPARLTRGGGLFSLQVLCTPEVEDVALQRILGPSLALLAEDGISGDAWSGRGTAASSAGWDTWIDAEVEFTNFTAPRVRVARSTVSLQLSGEAILELDPP